MATPVMITKGYLQDGTLTLSTTFTNKHVVTNITVTNIGNHTNTFSIFRTPSTEVAVNGVFQDDCRIRKDVSIGAGATVELNNLRWVLSNGDAIGISKSDGATGRNLIFYIDGVYVD